MTIRAGRFTPEVMLGAPRRGTGIPNSDGSLVLSIVTTYDFEAHEQKSEARVLNTSTKDSTVLEGGESLKALEWLDDSTAVGLNSVGDEKYEVVVGAVNDWKSSCVVQTIHANVTDLRVTPLDSGNYGIALSALANPDGTLYNSKAAPTTHSTARLYKSLFVRHWDTWITPQKKAIWYAALEKSTSGGNSGSGYTMTPLVNGLKNVKVESPIGHQGSTDNFDISRTGLAFVAKDPGIDPARNTKCNLYYIPLTTFRETDPKATLINAPGMEGAMTSPVFSQNGKQIAFLVMRQNGNEADKNNIFLVPDLQNPTKAISALPGWGNSPTAVAMNSDGSTLFIVAPNRGRVMLYVAQKDALSNTYNLEQSQDTDIERVNGSVSNMRSFGENSVLLSSTNFIDNSHYALVNLDGRKGTFYTPISSSSRYGKTFGLSQKQVSDFWFTGADPSRKVHSWVMVPSDFDPSKTYPLAFLIHGGPQGAWHDSWSTRWNPAVFAEQGYVVVSPNPTGSIGYGQDFTDAIQNQWGGLPYKDLVKCVEYIEQAMPYVDMDRAVAAGASYGGYMVNWIQGQPLGRKFKALVTHDGVFDTGYELATEELYFIYHDFGGAWSDNNTSYEKWNPARFTKNWATPHLIIHSELDYRLTISDGLAAFNVLQTQGIESEFLSFPDEGHWVSKPENSLVWHRVVLNFLNKHVGLPLLEGYEGRMD